MSTPLPGGLVIVVVILIVVVVVVIVIVVVVPLTPGQHLNFVAGFKFQTVVELAFQDSLRVSHTEAGVLEEGVLLLWER